MSFSVAANSLSNPAHLTLLLIFGWWCSKLVVNIDDFLCQLLLGITDTLIPDLQLCYKMAATIRVFVEFSASIRWTPVLVFIIALFTLLSEKKPAFSS